MLYSLILETSIIIKKILKRKFCPICKHRLITKPGNIKKCEKFETEWIFNPQTGVIKYALFYGNRKVKSQE